MREFLVELKDINQQAGVLIDVLKKKTKGFGYRDITYRLETLKLDEVAIEVIGFAFWNDAGESVTPGFFKFPECFEQPYNTVDRFADLVVYLTLNEIALRLKEDIRYCYSVNGRIYMQEEMTESLLAEATLLAQKNVPTEQEDGLYGCSDGLWLMKDAVMKPITLFDVCAVDQIS